MKKIDVLKSPRSIEYSSETCIKTFQTKNVFLQLFARESTNLQILNSKRRMQSGHVSIFIQTSLTGVEWNSNAKCFVKQKKKLFCMMLLLLSKWSYVFEFACRQDKLLFKHFWRFQVFFQVSTDDLPNFVRWQNHAIKIILWNSYI